MADQDPLSQSEQEERARVNRIEREQLAWTNILKSKLDIYKASKQQKLLQEEVLRLQGEEVKNAKKYENATKLVANAEKNLLFYQQQGDQAGIKRAKAAKAMFEARQQELQKSTGGALKAQEMIAAKKKAAYTAERNLILDINKQRGAGIKYIGTSFLDLFRTNDQIQRRIDIARAKAGGGANVGKAAGAAGTDVEKGKGRASAALGAMIAKLAAPLIAIKTLARDAIVTPFAEAANLLSGNSVGLGGGAVKATGVSSILGGLEKIASSIPFIGSLLGPVVSAFKGIVEAVLGIDQANFRVARSMNISVDQAAAMRKQFDGIANASGNLVMNSTRMLQSYIEIGSQLGINAQLSNQIYQNDVKLRDILGLEAESRKVLVDQSIVTGRNAQELTESVIGTVGAFNQLVGTTFKWSSILSEASKLGGYLGLTLTKYPEKIYKAILATKTLGMDLKQLDTTAASFLDFESSISKEMEAQVLTGKALNLTQAREAALNNDYATLSAEIAKNVGSTEKYLNMNRIQQDAIAESVGLTRDSLSDILKKQEIYTRAGVADQKGLVARLELLQQQKKTQDEISATLGKDGYALATQISTAERLTEMMEKLKIVIVNFVKESGLLDFLTKPEKINSFIAGLTDKLAGTVSIIGRLIASVVDLLGTVTFGETSRNFHSLASQIRGGTGEFAGTIRSVGENLGGAVARSVGSTVEAGVKQEAAQKPAGTNVQGKGVVAVSTPVTVEHKMDNQVIGKTTFDVYSQVYGLNQA